MVAMLATICGGAVAAKPAAPAAAKKKKTVEAKGTTAPELPTGHVGQLYGTKILGVMGIDVGDASCAVSPALPSGLDLDCGTMTIEGFPDKTVSKAPVNITVSDSEGHKVPVNFALTVIDGPDVVRVGGAKVANTAAKTAPEGRAEAARPQTALPVERTAKIASASRAVAAAHATSASAAQVAVAPVGEVSPDADGNPGPGVGIIVDPDTPIVEGATTIKGRIAGTTEKANLLCIALRLMNVDKTVSSAPLKAAKGGNCLESQAAVEANGEFTLNMTAPLLAGYTDHFEVMSSKSGRFLHVKGKNDYTISLELPLPQVEVTSLIRDGVKTISGSCSALPNPALTTNASATPPVVGNLPLVLVELHDPNAPGGLEKAKEKGKDKKKVEAKPVAGENPEYRYKDGEKTEWYTADLLVGDTKSPKTVQSDPATATADGCTFNVTLKTALAPGQLVRVKLKAPAGRYFGPVKDNKTEVMWPDDKLGGKSGDAANPGGTDKEVEREGRVAYTALAVAPPVITSELAVGTQIITGTGMPSPSNGTQVMIVAISDDDYEDLPTASTNAAKSAKKGSQGKKSGGKKSGGKKSGKDKDSTMQTAKDATAASPEASGGDAAKVVTQDELAARALNEEDEYGPAKPIEACRAPEEMTEYSGRFLPLQAGSKTAVTTTGTWSVTLATALQDGQRFHLVQVLPPHSKLTEAEKKLCRTTVSTVKGDLDWGRIHADFVGGVLISNDSSNSTAGAAAAGSGNFSQAHQFIALNVEKSWALPGCYLRVFAHAEEAVDEHKHVRMDENGEPILVRKPDQCFDWTRLELFDARHSQHFIPGFNTYFQTRLTAIPVSTVSTTGTTTGATGMTTGTISSTASNIISTAQTARVEVGAYLPFFITRWQYDHKPNALFFAPLAKSGFDTVTGPSTVNTIAVGGVTTQSQTYEQVYTFWSYGARIGHMELTRTENKAPETFSYLDIAFGPYSNLQSYICKPGPLPTNADGSVKATNSTCAIDYPNAGLGLDSRKRLYRFDIEGLLKLPKTPLYVGLNANIGQRTLGATHLDHGFAAPDDVRFLFGTKFDIADVLTKFKLGPH